MATKNDRGREGGDEMGLEEADASIVVTVSLPKETLARIDVHAVHSSSGSTREEALQRLLRIALDAEEKAAAAEHLAN
jgi:metal-responsive CopG/Arc/MetJ family transcriptional regulator